ncbi:MAG: hypothetical protein HC907_02290 [Richelia sp. SM1_7_0]|nr:hypothetical protein [Richelia sp. SM1_7_0]
MINLKSFQRKRINLSQEKLIKTDFFQPKQHLPLLVEPLIDGIDLATWATSNLEWIETQILKYGGILFAILISIKLMDLSILFKLFLGN